MNTGLRNDHQVMQISLDANGATQDILKNIVGKKADFVIGLKTNVKSLCRIADQIFSETRPKNRLVGQASASFNAYSFVFSSPDFWLPLLL